MKSRFNKKKFNFFSISKINKYLILFVFFGFLFFITLSNFIKNERFINVIETFSEKFNYQFTDYELNILYRADKIEINKILNQYLNKSIFLIPLNLISDSINNLKWIKNVNLSTDLKNNIKIVISEYKPIGLFYFNNQIFYFSEDGKIIDKYKEGIDEELILFYGNQVLKQASYFIKTVDKINHNNLFKINEAYYINERRWNIKLTNGILVYLSEKNIETSMKNYIKLINRLKDSKINSIQSIDLRNQKKAIIRFK